MKRAASSYRAARRNEAREAYKQLLKMSGRIITWPDYWQKYGQRIIPSQDADGNPVEKRRLGIKHKTFRAKTYTSNGVREAARRLRRMK